MGTAEDDEVIASGTPSNTEKKTAREKLSTAVMEITVDAKQRLSAFKTVCRGAFSDVGLDIVRVNRGMIAKNMNIVGERI